VVGGGEVDLGRRQGQPSRRPPFLFSLAIRDTLSALKPHLTTLFPAPYPPIILAYLDDIVILINNPSTIDHVADFFSSRHSSLSLNRAKSTIDDVEDIRRDGITFLGTAVGSTEFRRASLNKKVDEQVRFLDQLPSLSFQTALILLRQCTPQNLRHFQRCLRTNDLRRCWEEIDQQLEHSLRNLPFFDQDTSLYQPTRSMRQSP
jgi:hypothetical protein